MNFAYENFLIGYCQSASFLSKDECNSKLDEPPRPNMRVCFGSKNGACDVIINYYKLFLFKRYCLILPTKRDSKISAHLARAESAPLNILQLSNINDTSPIISESIWYEGIFSSIVPRSEKHEQK